MQPVRCEHGPEFGFANGICGVGCDGVPKLGFDVGERGVDLLFAEVELDLAGRVEDGNDGFVFLRLANGVGVDDVADDFDGVRTGEIDGGAGETETACIGQGFGQVACVTFEETVLRPVCLVGNDDVVVALGEDGKGKFSFAEAECLAVKVPERMIASSG